MSERQSKSTQDRHERILNELAKRPGNDLCADCGTRNPRWASYSHGVFLCIRCAGIHRKMGTHVSKIKSITMDQWSTEQIEMMRNSGGNTTVNSTVNPTNQLIPIASDDDNSMEKYIRAKWEKRLFMTPKRTVQSVVQAPPKRSSSVPVYMQPKDGILVQTPIVQQQSPVLVNQQTNVLTDEQKVDQLARLGFLDKGLSLEALRRAGGNIDIAITVLSEARQKSIPAQSNPFSVQQSANLVSQPQQMINSGPASQHIQQSANIGFPLQQQQTGKTDFTLQQQVMNGVFVPQQQQPQQLFNPTSTSHGQAQNIANAGIAQQQPNAPFNLQQTPTFSFTTHQKDTSSPFTQQQAIPNTASALGSINVNDPFGLSSNNFSGTSYNSSSAIPAFNSTPSYNNNTLQQPQMAPGSLFQPPVANNNPFSQTGTPFNIQNQPVNNPSPFINQSFNNNNMASNPWATNSYFN